jgi:hypothetical protein
MADAVIDGCAVRAVTHSTAQATAGKGETHRIDLRYDPQWQGSESLRKKFKTGLFESDADTSLAAPNDPAFSTCSIARDTEDEFVGKPKRAGQIDRCAGLGNIPDSTWDIA